MAEEQLTRQQMNKIMSFVDTAMMRQKFGSEKGEQKETGLKSLTDLENQIKDMNDVTGRLARGFRDLLKLPKSINQVFSDIEKIVYDSTSNYAQTINKISKINLQSIKTHGANSDAIKNQTKSILRSVHALSDFRDNAKKYNEITDLITKTKGRKEEIEKKPSSNITSSEKVELASIKSAELARDQFKKDINLQIEEIKEVLAGDNSLTDEMKQAFEQYKDTLNGIHESIRNGEQISADNLKTSDELLAVNKAQLQVTSITNTHFKEYIQSAQAQGKAMALAIGAMAVSIGKGINASTLSRQGANLADDNFVTAARMGLSPSELHSVTRTSATELGMAAGTFNAGDALGQSGFMTDLQTTARQIGLIGVEGAKAALETFNFQLRSGMYNMSDTNEQRVQSAETFLKAVKYGAAQINVPIDEYMGEIKQLMDSGDLSPIMDQLDKTGLTGDAYTSALVENVTAIKANIKNLGLNSNYLKLGLEMRKKAGGQGLEELIRGRVGASIGLSTVQSFTGQKFSKEDKDLLMRFQDVKDLNLFQEPEQKRILNLLAPFKKEQDEILSRRAKGIAKPGDMERLAMANTMLAVAPSDVTSQATLEMARESQRVRDANEKNKKPDGSTPMVNKSEEALQGIMEPLTNFENALLDAAQKIRGAFESPLGAPIGSALGWAGNATAELAGTVGGAYAASKLGLLGEAGKGGSKMMGMLKGGSKLALLGGLAYGAYSLLSSDGGGGSGGVGGSGSIVGPNGELSNATFSIQSAILNIGNSSQQIGSVSIPQNTPISTENGNFSSSAVLGVGAAALGTTGLSAVTTGVTKSLSSRLPGPLAGLLTGMLTYNELGEDPSVGRAERVGGAVGSGLGSAGGWWAGASAGAALGTAIGGTSLNPMVAGGLGIAGGLAGAYLGEAAVQKAGETVGSGLDYMTDSTAELFWQMDKFAENFGIGVQETPDIRAIQWIDENSNASGLPSTMLAAREEDSKNQPKQEEKQVLDIKTEEVKDFINKVTGFFENISNIGSLMLGLNKQKVLDERTEKQIAADAAASAQARVDSGKARVNDAVNRAVAKTNAPIW